MSDPETNDEQTELLIAKIKEIFPRISSLSFTICIIVVFYLEHQVWQWPSWLSLIVGVPLMAVLGLASIIGAAFFSLWLCNKKNTSLS